MELLGVRPVVPAHPHEAEPDRTRLVCPLESLSFASKHPKPPYTTKYKLLAVQRALEKEESAAYARDEASHCLEVTVFSLNQWFACAMSLGIEALLLTWVLWKRRGADHVFFNAQDYAAHSRQNQNPNTPPKQFPIASDTATFEPLLKQYVDVAKFLITIAAATIGFAGFRDADVDTAKLFLAFSIGFGLLFCVLVTLFYEDYLHDLTSYKPFKCALVESLGVSSLTCFAIGYFYWAVHLKSAAVAT